MGKLTYWKERVSERNLFEWTAEKVLSEWGKMGRKEERKKGKIGRRGR